MIAFQYHCPHCYTERSGFEVKNYSYLEVGSETKMSFLAVCNSCLHSVCMDYTCSRGQGKEVSKCANEQQWHNLKNLIHPDDWNFYPKKPNPDIPDFLPEKVAARFRAAEKIYLSCRSEYNADLIDAAGNAYRTMLEAALALIDGGGDKNLNRRINALVESNRLTEEMGRFAHRIRCLGNQASHSELEFTRQELDDLRLFAKLFVLYLFTLPAMLPEDIQAA